MAAKLTRRPAFLSLSVLAGRPLLYLYWMTCRVRARLGTEHLDRVLESGQPFIPCYWHQMHFLGARFVRRLAKDGLKLGFLVSPSGDGEIPARLARGWGAQVIRGSSSRTGAQALRDLFQVVKQQGVSPLMTSDGPRGPLHEFKPGAILLAQMTGAPILPIAYAANRYWQLSSWDRFIVPKPFSRAVFAIGEPRYVPRDLTLGEIEPVQREIEATMAELIRQARAAAK